MNDELLAGIERELERLAATPDAAGEDDSIGVNDEGGGWASLGDSELRGEFYWYGRQEQILARLSRLPDGAGPEAVRLEFVIELPPHLG